MTQFKRFGNVTGGAAADGEQVGWVGGAKCGPHAIRIAIAHHAMMRGAQGYVLMCLCVTKPIVHIM